MRTKKNVKKSEFLSLDSKDFLKSLVVAGLVSLFSSLSELLTSSFTLDKETLAYLATGFVSGMLGYLTRNYTRNSDGKQFSREYKK